MLRVLPDGAGYGYGRFTGSQLKILQEAITLAVCCGFAFFCLGEAPRWNLVLAFGSILAAVALAFGGGK